VQLESGVESSVQRGDVGSGEGGGGWDGGKKLRGEATTMLLVRDDDAGGGACCLLVKSELGPHSRGCFRSL